MRQSVIASLLCFCLIHPFAFAGGARAAEKDSIEDLLPVVTFLYRDREQTVWEQTLLIVVHQSTGKAMKATLPAGLLPAGAFDPQTPQSMEDMVKEIGEKIGFPQAYYACLRLDALADLEAESARQKDAWALIRLGLSLLGAVDTNLSLGKTVSVFRRAFAQGDTGIELSFPELCGAGEEGLHSADWEAIRSALSQAAEQLL